MLRSSLLLPLCFAALVLADSSNSHTRSEPKLRLYHRFLSPSSELSATSGAGSSFLPLGQLNADGAGSYGLIGADSDQTEKREVTDDGKGWYQVALQRDEDEEAEWMISSTRACYLSSPPKIRISIDHSSQPSYISLASSGPSGAQGQGRACSEKSVVLPKSAEGIVLEFNRFIDVVKSPQLSAPPQLDPTTGTAIVPAPEKPFFQKYWMYIVGIALFFAISMGPDEPKSAAPAS